MTTYKIVNGTQYLILSPYKVVNSIDRISNLHLRFTRLKAAMDEKGVPILAKKHVSTVLLFVLGRGTVNKTDIVSVVPSNTTVDNLVRELKGEELITVSAEFAGRKTYSISLTPKGRQVAEQLKRAEEAAKGIVINEWEGRAEIPAETAEEWAKKFREATKGMSLLYHVNVYQDHVTIGQEIAGKSHMYNIYVKVNGKGIMRLWCESDEAYDCAHVQYAWTIPKVQEMYGNAVRDGKANGK